MKVINLPCSTAMKKKHGDKWWALGSERCRFRRSLRCMWRFESTRERDERRVSSDIRFRLMDEGSLVQTLESLVEICDQRSLHTVSCMIVHKSYPNSPYTPHSDT
jgi:hypothetical protein